MNLICKLFWMMALNPSTIGLTEKFGMNHSTIFANYGGKFRNLESRFHMNSPGEVLDSVSPACLFTSYQRYKKHFLCERLKWEIECGFGTLI